MMREPSRLGLIRGTSPISIVNSGKLSVSAFDEGSGIYARGIVNNPISIINSGNITSIGTGPFSDVYGIQARTFGAGSPIIVENSGNMVVSAPSDASGIFALAENNGGGRA